MKVTAVIFLLFMYCTSCKQSPVTSALLQSDSLVVQFLNEKEVLENAVKTTDQETIRKIAGFVGTGYQDSTNCKKKKILVFYQGRKEIQRVIWKPDCRQFEFNFQGKKRFTGMSKEAFDYISDITDVAH